MEYELKNNFIRLHWDAEGCLTEFVNLKTGRQLVKGHCCCRVILGSPDLLEFEAVPAGLKQVEEHPDSIAFHYDEVIGENGKTYAIESVLKIRLCQIGRAHV